MSEFETWEEFLEAKANAPDKDAFAAYEAQPRVQEMKTRLVREHVELSNQRAAERRRIDPMVLVVGILAIIGLFTVLSWLE